MKYIFTDSKGMHFGKYFEYIQSLKSILPPHVYTFADVRAYSAISSSAKEGLGDLMAHEVRVGEKETLIHELHFANGTIVIECGNFRHSEEINSCDA